MIVRLAHVCIESSDLEATEQFYTALGLKRQFEFRNKQDELIGMYLAFGEMTFLEIIKVRQVRAEGAVRHFAIEVDDVQAIHSALQSQNIPINPCELGEDKTWMVTCTDPNGVFIEFHQYTQQSMQRVGGTCVLDYQPR